MRRFAIIILDLDDIHPGEEDKARIVKMIEESLQWWHGYLGHSDRLEFDKWKVYYMEFGDELMVARVLNALGKFREYIKGEI
ncbi:hypothetical protein [Vulcanisaeta souniana]|uniref:Uncharacterized protein n=1 Tax=Vulcanisaeta souniana JCM 11219 TaxID=1293586 RepID=A0A830EE67_9CREN|nr:hypothetical protein [Vulcanisaeta souniana]BDR93365.1 hypothetical protein Vsou_24580 [Vulcanisaeta souniana JCM 11219]GGI76587.1 hypothetical protein GCM10007112_11710 [Vulcanisaeta souniana JCM 11219]